MSQSTSPHDNAEFLKAEKQANAIYDECYKEHYGAIPQKGEDGYSNYLQLKNTFQHSYTSAYFAYNYSPEVSKTLGLAKEILTAHKEVKAHTHDWKQWLEGRGWEQSFLDGNRDMWNNVAGIEYAKQGMQHSQGLETIGQNIFNGIIDGDIFIIDFQNDPRRWCGVDDFGSYWNMLLSEFLQELNNHPGNIGILALIANPEFVKGLILHSSLLPLMSINDFGNLILEMFDQAANTQPIVYDPILIDLNGDGIKTTNIDNGVYFDHQMDGFAESSAWVDENDGILAIDKNSDGIINDGSEIFGDNYVKANGSKATSGFDALRDLDSNNDGIISADDTEFNNIKILKGNGEVLTLEEAGIVSINLNSTTKNMVDENGNTLVSLGTFVRADGTTGNLGDFNLAIEKAYSKETSIVEVSDEIKALPNISSFGTVHSLRQSMMLDKSGELKGLIEDFVAAKTTADKRSLIKQILYKWAGADKVTVASGGYHYDGQKLYVIEQFMGEEFVGANNDGKPTVWAAPFLDDCYNQITEYVYYKLMVQTDEHLKSLYDLIELEYCIGTDSIRYNFDGVIEYIDNLLNEDETLAKSELLEVTQIIKTFGLDKQGNYEEYIEHFNSLEEEYGGLLNAVGKNLINGTDEAETIEGTTGADAVFAGEGDDIVRTRQGDDLVYGGAGDDTIDTCEGNDLVYGGDGNDSIIGGDGNDTIYGEDGNDYINPGRGSDKVYGGSGNDTIQFTDNDSGASNYIDGGDGNDRIEIRDGSNTIAGGKGNDYIGMHNNTYCNGKNTIIYNLGDGDDTIKLRGNSNDTLKFGEGITLENIIFRGQGNDLIIQFKDIEGLIRVTEDLSNNDRRIESFVFSDGTVLNHSQMLKNFATIEGTEEGDTISASYADESIYGYGGNDSIDAKEGNDVIYAGEGHDTVDAGSGNDLVYGGDGNDVIDGWYGDDVIYGENGNDLITGGNSNDTVYGGEGNDTIKFINGTNTLSGDKGDDYIQGGTSADTYLYNLGDGNDIIVDSAGNDAIAFGEGIASNDIMAEVNGENLKISFNKFDGSITINKAAADANYRVENFRFTDGTSLTYNEIIALNNSSVVSTTSCFANSKTSTSEDEISTNTVAYEADINNIIQDVTAYNISDDAIISYTDDVNKNQEILTLVNS